MGGGEGMKCKGVGSLEWEVFRGLEVYKRDKKIGFHGVATPVRY